MASSLLPDPAQLAGGGNSETIRVVDSLNQTLLTYLKTIFAARSGGTDQPWTAEQLSAFCTEIQREGGAAMPTSLLAAAEEGGGGLDFEGFVKYMTSSATALTAPPKEEDLSWPLAAYFISSSHNTYLTGNQLSSDSSTAAYKNVLLRGCRCIEVDVWDGDDSDSEDSSSDEEKEAVEGSELKKKKKKQSTFEMLKSKLKGETQKTDEKIAQPREPVAATQEGSKKVKNDGIPALKPGAVEPRVLHGYTLTKEITFRDVCVAIRDSAFKVSDLPVIVSLEVHCTPEQQDRMVEIMEHAFKGMLVPIPEGEPTELPAPQDLRNKIIVKVKYAPPPGASPEQQQQLLEDDYQDRLPQGGSAAAKGTAAAAAKPSKITQALSNMGFYSRGVSFKSLTQAEATMPTHIFSLSEKKVAEVHGKQAEKLFEHNLHYMMRTYPHGLRIGSSNLDPAPFWRKGIQVVALNWQNWDEGMMLNEGMFAGTHGYVLKPEGEYQAEPFLSLLYLLLSPLLHEAISEHHQLTDSFHRLPHEEARRKQASPAQLPNPRPLHRSPRRSKHSSAPRRRTCQELPPLRKSRDPRRIA